MFNAGADFTGCINALLAQTLTSLEIIIVDDGSTDGSGERADALAQQYPYPVIHQPNGGVSRARNAGLAVARGKYVSFPDADDTMDPAMYQTLVDMAERDRLDAAQCNAEWFFKASQTIKPMIPRDRLTSTGVLSGPEWLNKALKTRRYLHVVWLGIYRRELIEQLNLQFEPGLHHQDIRGPLSSCSTLSACATPIGCCIATTCTMRRSATASAPASTTSTISVTT